MASSSSTQPRLSVRGLWKLFGSNAPSELSERITNKSKAELREQEGLVLALRDVGFDVQAGETFVVMGLSGSGKSTLVRTLIRLIEPTFGQIRVDGEDILDYNEDQLIQFRRTKTAMVFQHFGLLPHRTVEDNAAWGLEVQGIPKQERTERAREVLELVGLKGWESYRPGALSGGMQQRVGLARVLVNDPDLLLLDEPASGLDPRARIELMEILRALRQMGKTIFISSHILSELAELCDSVTIIDRGHIRYSGAMRDLLEQNSDAAVYRLSVPEEQPGLEDRLLALEEVVSAERIEESLEFRIRCSPGAESDNRLLAAVLGLEIPIESFQKELRHLNEAFMDLTEQGVR